MRVRPDATGVVVSASEDLEDPCVIFPVNWPPEQFLGLKVLTGLSGMRLLVDDRQVLAREDAPAGANSTTSAAVTAAVAAYMTAHPDLKGPPGDPGAPGAPGTPGTAGSNATFRNGATPGLMLKVYTDTAVTNASGAVTFTLPAGYFTSVFSADATAVRDTNNPVSATFAQVRAFSTTSVSVQCFESRTTGVLLLNTNVEGLEAGSTAGITVQLVTLGV